MLHLFSKNSYMQYVWLIWIFIFENDQAQINSTCTYGRQKRKKQFPNYHNLNLCVCQLMEAGAGGGAGVGV